MAGDPLGEWRPSKNESLDEWAERQRWAREPEPDERSDRAELVTRVAAGVVLAVLIVVLVILELL